MFRKQNWQDLSKFGYRREKDRERYGFNVQGIFFHLFYENLLSPYYILGGSNCSYSTERGMVGLGIQTSKQNIQRSVLPYGSYMVLRGLISGMSIPVREAKGFLKRFSFFLQQQKLPLPKGIGMGYIVQAEEVVHMKIYTVRLY